jgi:hypothetical protein
MRERLRRDPFLFALVLGALGFAAFCLAVTWWYFRDAASLASTVALVLVTLALFRGRG